MHVPLLGGRRPNFTETSVCIWLLGLFVQGQPPCCQQGISRDCSTGRRATPLPLASAVAQRLLNSLKQLCQGLSLATICATHYMHCLPLTARCSFLLTAQPRWHGTCLFQVAGAPAAPARAGLSRPRPATCCSSTRQQQLLQSVWGCFGGLLLQCPPNT